MNEDGRNYPKRRLAKSSVDKKVCGVCGGIAEYTGLDVSIIRIITLFIIFSGVGVLFYFIIAMILPNDYEVYAKKKNNSYSSDRNQENNQNNNDSDWID